MAHLSIQSLARDYVMESFMCLMFKGNEDKKKSYTVHHEGTVEISGLSNMEERLGKPNTHQYKLKLIK